jgi:hypothetical protein
MAVLVLTKEALAAIRSASDRRREFVETARERPDGLYDVPVGDEVEERIRTAAFPGESDSDTIVRMVAFFHSGGKAN